MNWDELGHRPLVHCAYNRQMASRFRSKAGNWEVGREEDNHKGRNHNRRSGRDDGVGDDGGDGAKGSSMDNLDTVFPQALNPRRTWILPFGRWWLPDRVTAKRSWAPAAD